jgi:hypothetical protein
MATIDIGKIKPVFKGTYDNSTAYVLDDIVYYNGSSYVAKASTTGNLPTDTTKWNVLASGSGGIWDSTLALGTAGKIVQVNSGATALEFTDPPQGISETDQWRFTTNSTSVQNPFGGSGNFERVDDPSWAKIGTGMTNSSGIFSFPVTGMWLCEFTWDMDSSNTGGQMNCYVSTDSGSNYDLVARQHTGDGQGWYVSSHCFAHVNVTNVSTFRLKWEKTGGSNLYGNTAYNQSFLTFTRLGDSQ